MDNTKRILQIARQTISIEQEALLGLIERIDSEFVEAVEAIHRCTGRVIVSGVGKSAIIGQKYVATFNSMGTPAFFMHATDAMHGDMGMILSNDIFLCLSKSGETAELKSLLPRIRQFGNPIVAVLCNRESFIARLADHVIYFPITQEADPNNLAPTTSTTAQIAIGDALATSLAAIQEFRPADFANFHPGGSLGKRLYLKVEDLLSVDHNPAVATDSSIKEVIVEISSKRLGATAVINDNDKVLGIITDGDLRRMLTAHPHWENLQAGDIYTKNPKVIQPDALVVDALDRMRKNSITQLIVTKQGKYQGMIHLHEILKEGII